MKKNLSFLFIGMGAMLVLILLTWTNGCNGSENQTVFQTDTVFVNKLYKEMVIKEVEKPVTVYVYKTDTVFRTKIERDTLITSVEITPEFAKIHTITPRGVPIIKEYRLPEFKQIKIDHEGNTQIKRKKSRKKLKNTLRTIGATISFVGGVWVGIKISN